MDKKKRVVHYKSDGTGGLCFPCYKGELRAYLDNNKPKPQCRTSLNQVTCPECWRNILDMAVEFAGDL